jgi:hypothetical protein
MRLPIALVVLGNAWLNANSTASAHLLRSWKLREPVPLDNFPAAPGSRADGSRQCLGILEL